jgi:transketolase
VSEFALNSELFSEDILKEPVRAGFGRGLKKAGELNENIVGLCADLTESVYMHLFAEAFPERFIQVGIAEQNLVTIASGLAHAGKIPFAASYAAFSPGRNWEQIKTTICINQQPVKVIGGHAGLTVGPDGATHQMLEDIALMRVLPGMVVIAPGDSIEAEKATLAIANNGSSSYLRLCREKTPAFSSEASPFEIGRAYVLREGNDITLFGTGIMTYQLLVAAKYLEESGVQAEIVHVPTIKPLDETTVLTSVKKTGRAVTAEEAQIAGGFGSAIVELLSEKLPIPVRRLGVVNRFGESGAPIELLDHFNLTGPKLADNVKQFINIAPKYKQGF